MDKLLLTGSSGFIGKNILEKLSSSYEITTLGITDKEDITLDISKEIPAFNESFDVVVHTIGLAHVESNSNEELYFRINYEGTKNLCEGFKENYPVSFIFISTVAVYGIETGIDISEEEPLLGDSPYAKSKILAEHFLTNWANINNVNLCILRPSLVAGKNPPGNLKKMINGVKNNKYFRIGSSQAIKSVFLVDDFADLIPRLSTISGIYNVCDDDGVTFKSLDQIISKQLGKSEPRSIPYWLIRFIAWFGDFLGDKAPINSKKLKKISNSLTFSNAKIKNELNWTPTNVLENFKIE